MGQSDNSSSFGRNWSVDFQRSQDKRNGRKKLDDTYIPMYMYMPAVPPCMICIHIYDNSISYIHLCMYRPVPMYYSYGESTGM